MKQLYYTLMTLLRGHGSNIIKVVSLTLGLLVGIILFARIAFELSFNTGYGEYKNLAQVFITYHNSDGPQKPGDAVVYPVANAMMNEFPDEIEYATTIQYRGDAALYVGEQRHTGNLILGDTLFFKTMQIPITSGSEMELAVPDMAFVSEDFAKRTFNTTDVIGNTLMLNKNHEITIRGTFKEVGENNRVKPDVLLSFATHVKYNWGYRGWDGGDSFRAFIRLREASDLEKINKRIDAVVEQYVPFNVEEYGSGIRLHLENIKKQHTNNPDAKRMVFIMSFLALAILLIAAMNYVLIAISSLSRRAKGVGVHKCNGASEGQIFSMFLYETGIIILISLLLVGLLIYNLQGFIKEIIEASVSSLFTWQTLWVPALIVVLVFIIAGVIPGRIFANIPVTQVFRKYTERNASWKRILLFIQFTGVSFVFGLLVVIFLQYDRMMNYDLGYKTENIAVADCKLDNMDLAASTILNLPMVDKVSLSLQTLGIGYSGDIVRGDDGRELFSTRFNLISPEFISLYGVQIIEGRNVVAPGEILINEEFIRLMPWTDNVIGRNVATGSFSGTVVGVMKDFVASSLYVETQPVAFVYYPAYRCITAELKEPFEEALINLNREVKDIFPTSDVIFFSFEKYLEDKYVSVRRFRDSAMIAFIGILLITLMGLFGYINDEIQRRSKEIAIRKVNGAEAWNILRLLSKEVSLVAVPAILVGIIISYFIGKEWLDQFAAAIISLNVAVYILLCIVIYVVIIACVILKSWRVANENPVNSIKSE